MRSAQLTTSPSGVDGAGRDQLWLAMPSTVSRAQVERRERDQRAPRRVVEAPGHVGVERVLAGVAARAVAAVVAERDRLGERDVQPQRPGDGACDLGHLERMGQPGALMVLGEDEDLGLAGQAAEGGGMEDPVAVALEAGAPLVGLLARAGVRRRPRRGWRRARAASPRGPRVRRGRRATTGSGRSVAGAAGRRTDPGVRVGVGQAHGARVARHRRCPADIAFRPHGAVGSAHAMQSVAWQ